MAITDFLNMDGKARVYTSARKGAGGKPVTDVEITNKATVKDVFSGSSTVTKTYTDKMEHFAIQNNGANALTVTINGFSIPVDAGEGFSEDFDPFNSVTVTATSAFKALVKGRAIVIPDPIDSTAPTVSVSPNGGSFATSQQVTLTANESAIIYYTTNGTTPTESSSFYISPITISTTTTLKFFAKDDAGNTSSIQTVTFTKQANDTTAPTVSASPNGGTFTGSQLVTLTSNETATIYYTIDGTNPTTSSLVYSSPITITNTLTLKFFARDTAGNSSSIQTVTYTKQEVADTTAPTVTVSPVAGTYSSTQSVTLSANETATIHYTVDGSTPTTSSTVYSGPISISSTTTLKYFGRDTAGNNSTVQTATFTINAADTTAPVLTITPGGTFTDTKTVTMTTNETATIYYTLDDTDPKTSGTKLTYTAPLTLTETDTIKAYAKDSANNESAVQTVTYTKEAPASGEHVSDASLTFFKLNPVNGETIPNPENYFVGTTDFTYATTFQPVVNGSNAANVLLSRFLLGGSENVVKFDFGWNNIITGTLYGTKADGTSSWNPQVSDPTARTDHSKYYHLVFKREGTKFSLYVDNVLASEVTILTTDIVRQGSSLPLTIGQSGKSGLFKNSAYYNRALTTAELTQNYNALK